MNDITKPAIAANFRPLILASNAAGIEVQATPNIITVIGKVAIEGSSTILVDKIPPINTITGEAAITRGCDTNNSQMFLGKVKTRDKPHADKNKRNKVMIILMITLDLYK